MAVVQWNETQKKILVHDHQMSGKPVSLAFDEDYTHPVDLKRVQDISNLFKQKYSLNLEFMGTPWDYNQSELPKLHTDTPVGHYRVCLDDRDYILCVNRYDGAEAIALGAATSLMWNQTSTEFDVTSPLSLPYGGWTETIFNGDTPYYVHLETFTPNTKSFFKASAEDLPEKWPQKLGSMVGGIYKSSQSFEIVSSTLKQRIREFSDSVSIRCWKEGYNAFKEQDFKISSITNIGTSTDAHETDELSALFAEAIHIIKNDAPEIINSDNRIATTFNMIDKTVAFQTNGRILLQTYDTPSRGYVGMITPNATYDVGSSVARILTKKELYADAATTNLTMKTAFRKFASAYNDKSGLSLTPDEMLQAGKRVAAMQLLYSVGYNKLSGDVITTDDLSNHITEQIIPQFNRLNALDI